jgi:hypothetical protein
MRFDNSGSDERVDPEVEEEEDDCVGEEEVDSNGTDEVDVDECFLEVAKSPGWEDGQMNHEVLKER